MSRSLQVDILVRGAKALFLDKNIPHTGIIENVYRNVITLKDVTFLDKVLDYEYKDQSISLNRRFEVQFNTNRIYRTDRFYLPKYPSIKDQLFVNAVMNSLKINSSTGEIDIHDFMNTYPQRSLNVHPDAENGVSFNEKYTVILFDDEVTNAKEDGKKIYKVLKYNENDHAKGYVLLEYTSDSPLSPRRAIYSKWKNQHRNFKYINGYENEDNHIDDISAVIKDMYNLDIPIEVDHNFNEDHIIQILEYSPVIAYANYKPGGNFEITGLENTWKVVNKDLIVSKKIFYDEKYRKDMP